MNNCCHTGTIYVTADITQQLIACSKCLLKYYLVTLNCKDAVYPGASTIHVFLQSLLLPWDTTCHGWFLNLCKHKTTPEISKLLIKICTNKIVISRYADIKCIMGSIFSMKKSNQLSWRHLFVNSALSLNRHLESWRIYFNRWWKWWLWSYLLVQRCWW